MDEYIDNSDVNINFHGIEMRGLNDRPRENLSVSNLEMNEIFTKSSVSLQVYVQRGKKSTALVTFHDIGTNHNSFLSFFNYPEMLVILDNFTVYNICAPGHNSQSPKAVGRSPSSDENFRLLSVAKQPDEVEGEMFTDSQKQQQLATYPTMDELAEMVDLVAEHFELKYFLGMGVGAGANVLARFAMRNPSKLLGLFLISPDDTTSGYYQWTKARWSDLPSLRTGLITDWLENYLLDHWFGSTSDRNLDVQEYYLQLLQEMNHASVAGYIESYLNRTALGLVRPLGDLDKTSKTIDVDSCLITGEFSTDLTRAMVEMNGNMNPSKTQFLSIPESSGMVMDEAPGRLSNIFLNFLRNLGILITMTPEKLQKAAIERQISNARALSETETVRVTYEFSNRC